jgi:4a-hydroxytetrahydrobiopterin dehydratase
VSLPERCAPCREGDPALTPGECEAYLAEVPAWSIDGDHLVREWTLPDFRAALKVANRVGMVAEELDHHPDIRVHSWNKLELRCWTHTVGGLSVNDFVLAKRVDREVEA